MHPARARRIYTDSNPPTPPPKDKPPLPLPVNCVPTENGGYREIRWKKPAYPQPHYQIYGSRQSNTASSPPSLPPTVHWKVPSTAKPSAATPNRDRNGDRVGQIYAKTGSSAGHSNVKVPSALKHKHAPEVSSPLAERRRRERQHVAFALPEDSRATCVPSSDKAIVAARKPVPTTKVQPAAGPSKLPQFHPKVEEIPEDVGGSSTHASIVSSRQSAPPSSSSTLAQPAAGPSNGTQFLPRAEARPTPTNVIDSSLSCPKREVFNQTHKPNFLPRRLLPMPNRTRLRVDDSDTYDVTPIKYDAAKASHVPVAGPSTGQHAQYRHPASQMTSVPSRPRTLPELLRAKKLDEDSSSDFSASEELPAYSVVIQTSPPPTHDHCLTTLINLEPLMNAYNSYMEPVTKVKVKSERMKTLIQIVGGYITLLRTVLPETVPDSSIYRSSVFKLNFSIRVLEKQLESYLGKKHKEINTDMWPYYRFESLILSMIGDLKALFAAANKEWSETMYPQPPPPVDPDPKPKDKHKKKEKGVQQAQSPNESVVPLAGCHAFLSSKFPPRHIDVSNYVRPGRNAIIRDRDTGPIAAATLPALIYTLTDPVEAHDKDYAENLDAFFLLFHGITSPAALVQALVERFREAPSLGSEITFSDRFSPEYWKLPWAEYRCLFQTRVILLVLLWLHMYWIHETDEQIQPGFRFIMDSDPSLFQIDPVVHIARGRIGSLFKQRTAVGYELYNQSRRLPRVKRWECLRDIGKSEIIEFDKVDCAMALIVLEKRIVDNIRAHEFASLASTPTKSLTLWDRFTGVLISWVKREITVRRNIKKRTVATAYFIEVANICIEKRNFSGAYAILLAIEQSGAMATVKKKLTIPESAAFTRLKEFFFPSNPLNKGVYNHLRWNVIPTIPRLDSIKLDMIQYNAEEFSYKSDITREDLEARDFVLLSHLRHQRRTLDGIRMYHFLSDNHDVAPRDVTQWVEYTLLLYKDSFEEMHELSEALQEKFSQRHYEDKIEVEFAADYQRRREQAKKMWNFDLDN
ncbi:hypothetical protein ABKN59_004643 [Abortiporus biennis]